MRVLQCHEPITVAIASSPPPLFHRSPEGIHRHRYCAHRLTASLTCGCWCEQRACTPRLKLASQLGTSPVTHHHRHRLMTAAAARLRCVPAGGATSRAPTKARAAALSGGALLRHGLTRKANACPRRLRTCAKSTKEVEPKLDADGPQVGHRNCPHREAWMVPCWRASDRGKRQVGYLTRRLRWRHAFTRAWCVMRLGAPIDRHGVTAGEWERHQFAGAERQWGGVRCRGPRRRRPGPRSFPGRPRAC